MKGKFKGMFHVLPVLWNAFTITFRIYMLDYQFRWKLIWSFNDFFSTLWILCVYICVCISICLSTMLHFVTTFCHISFCKRDDSFWKRKNRRCRIEFFLNEIRTSRDIDVINRMKRSSREIFSGLKDRSYKNLYSRNLCLPMFIYRHISI